MTVAAQVVQSFTTYAILESWCAYLRQAAVAQAHLHYIPGLFGVPSNQLPLFPGAKVAVEEGKLLLAMAAGLQKLVFGSS